MKKFISALQNGLSALLGVLLFLPIVIGFLLYTPFDYIKYRRTRYYRDTKEKYRWLAGISYFIRLYDALREADLPVDYRKCADGCEYLLYKDLLILNEYDPCYDSDRNIWTVEFEDEHVNIEEVVAKDIEYCNESIGTPICRRVLVLADDDELSDSHPIELTNCTIVQIGEGGIAEALRKYLDDIA